jgi:glycosyltransferase involved in cell wall biosynthesis
LSAHVSIIIPNLHSPVLGQTLQSVESQDYDLSQVEVFVVGLDCHGLARPMDQVADRFHVIETDGPVSEARNLGIQASVGRFLVFLDSDCIATEEWLSRLVRDLEQGHPVVGGGVAVPGGSYWATGYNISSFHEFLACAPPGPRPYLPTLNLAMHREVAEQVGSLDEALPRAEDIDWTVRMQEAGYPLYFDPLATVFHQPGTSLRRIWRKWLNTGFCSWEVRRRYADSLSAPAILSHPHLLFLLSPAVATVRAAGIYVKPPALLRYGYTYPTLYLTKLAWCWGAAAAGGADWLRRYLFSGDERMLT